MLNGNANAQKASVYIVWNIELVLKRPLVQTACQLYLLEKKTNCNYRYKSTRKVKMRIIYFILKIKRFL